MDWPKQNEQLFGAGDDGELNACLNYFYVTPGTIADGYKEGADALAVSTAERKTTLDLVIYPISFLYRQYLELKIKYIIDLTRKLESQGRGFPETHNLKELWTEALQLLRTHYGDDLPPEIDNVQSCIDEFSDIDPKSMAFRYPTDRQGRMHLKDMRHINLRNLFETMERIGSLLDTIAGYSADRLQTMYEMERDNAPY